MMNEMYGLEIHSLIGSVVSKTNSEKGTKYQIKLFPTRELILTGPLFFDIMLPVDFHVRADGVEILIHDVTNEYVVAIRKLATVVSQDNKTFSIKFPFLENTKYAVSVWFFVVRNMFVNQNLPKWIPSIVVEDGILALEDKRCLPLSTPVSLYTGVGRNKGRRSYMEDVSFGFDVIQVKGSKGVGVYGVLDGHGGAECGQFASEELPPKIVTNLRKNVATADALYQSFLSVDEDFLRTTSNSSGSTACVFVWDRHLLCGTIANTGDTRAVLCRKRKAVDLTKDRKATDPEEIARIAIQGGFVANGRVLGSLAISRAFGDRSLKVVAKDAKDGNAAVNSSEKESSGKNYSRVLLVDPEITTFHVQPELDEYVVIATDGLWDVMSSQQVVDFVNILLTDAGWMQEGKLHSIDTILGLLRNSTKSISNLGSSGSDLTDANGGSSSNLLSRKSSKCPISSFLNKIADQLVNHAIKNLHSMDNVTAMILLLNPCRNVDSSMFAVVSECISRIKVTGSPKAAGNESRFFDLSSKNMKDVGKQLSAEIALDELCKADDSKSLKKPAQPIEEDLLDFLMDDRNF